jgi:hypothetical protein
VICHGGRASSGLSRVSLSIRSASRERRQEQAGELERPPQHLIGRRNRTIHQRQSPFCPREARLRVGVEGETVPLVVVLEETDDHQVRIESHAESLQLEILLIRPPADHAEIDDFDVVDQPFQHCGIRVVVAHAGTPSVRVTDDDDPLDSRLPVECMLAATPDSQGVRRESAILVADVIRYWLPAELRVVGVVRVAFVRRLECDSIAAPEILVVQVTREGEFRPGYEAEESLGHRQGHRAREDRRDAAEDEGARGWRT